MAQRPTHELLSNRIDLESGTFTRRIVVRRRREISVQHYARAPWIAFQDSDELTEPDHLETLHFYANEHPRCGMVFANGAS